MPQMNPREMQKALALPFAPEDLEWRIQTTSKDKTRGMAVPYVTNRAIQTRLDEVCGPDNWYNDFKPWHANGKKESQLCGIAIHFEGKGFITKWDGAEDSDIESVKGGLSDSMKRAAVQWGIGRVLYNMDSVWVDIEQYGSSYVIKNSERAKLDNAYLNALKRLGLEPAKASGIQSLLTPKTAPDQKIPPNEKSDPVSQKEQNRAQQKPAPASQEQSLQGQTTARQTQPTVPELFTVLDAKVQSGMSGSNTVVRLESPDRKPFYAYVRGSHPELLRGMQLFNVKLTTRKQDNVIFYVVESYEIYVQTQQAA